MSSPAEPDAGPAAGVLLDARARPKDVQLVVVAITAVTTGATAAWLAHAIDSDPARGWGLGIGVGAAVGSLVAWLAMLGSRVVVAADGRLTYSLHGRPNLTVDLRDCCSIRPLAAGMVGGIGIELSDPGRVRYLHKSGISPERLRRWRAQFGTDLILEGFPPAMAAELERLRARLPGLAAGAVAPAS